MSIVLCSLSNPDTVGGVTATAFWQPSRASPALLAIAPEKGPVMFAYVPDLRGHRHGSRSGAVATPGWGRRGSAASVPGSIPVQNCA